MKNVILSFMFCVVVVLLTGCEIPMIIESIAADKDLDTMQKHTSITEKFSNHPDTDDWRDQRQKIAQALGDRVFDKEFSRVFDSLVLAISTMELQVSNMERQSGYISASGIMLTEKESKEIGREAVYAWCRQNGIDPSSLDVHFQSSTFKRSFTKNGTDDMIDLYNGSEAGNSLTFQLLKMGENQTKVKLRFSNVYYPGRVEIYYKLVWQAVDKQIFVDQNIEGTVEERK
ncbi:MAG: hypothetical protein AAB893_00665 [Patescibacteria group bacterium]